jgi:hypothetical protein
LRSNSLGKHDCQAYILVVEKTAKKFRSFAEAEKADRDFYKKLTGNERLRILVELLNMGLSKDWKEFLELLNSRGDAFASKVLAELDGVPVSVLGKDALIGNERAVGRPQDQADIDTLEN